MSPHLGLHPPKVVPQIPSSNISVLNVTADSIRYVIPNETLELKNITELSLPDLRVHASFARILLWPFTLTILNFNGQFQISPGVVELSATRAKCRRNHCTLFRPRLFPCPRDARFLSFRARRIHLENNTIRLQSPRIYIGKIPVFGLPHLKLVPPSRPGFLLPVMGWSPEFGVRLGPRLYFPISNRQHFIAHTAIRGTRGLDNSLSGTGRHGYMLLNHLYQSSQNMFQVKSRGYFAPQKGGLATDVHIASNKQIIDQLAFFPGDRAINHTESRFRFGVENPEAAFESQLIYFQHLPGDTQIRHTGQLHIGTHWYPLPNGFNHIQPRLALSIDRALADTQTPTQNRTRFQAMPVVMLPFQIFHLHTELQLGALAQQYQIDATSTGHSRLLPGASLSAGLPLVKKKGHVSHLLHPIVVMQLAPVESGNAPRFPSDQFDAATSGAHFMFTVLNTLGHQLSHPWLQLHPTIHLRKMMVKKAEWEPLASIRVQSEYRWFSAQANALWHIQPFKLNQGLFALSVASSQSSSFTSALYFRDTSTASFLSHVPLTTDIWPVALPHSTQTHTILSHQLRLILTHQIQLHISPQFELWPGISLSALSYSIEFASSCRCLTASITAAHRPQHIAPDTMLNITWHPR
ncbi:MAG: LPS assembly protein LptD [Deltaproteobacteria bacterium]|nr:LPS assembly protein LptD [Deltaproteobacteria bacterium]